jgi:predicted small secreted protein
MKVEKETAMKKFAALFAMLIIASMILSACGGAGGGNTIKVGGITELTGDIPAVGSSLQKCSGNGGQGN